MKNLLKKYNVDKTKLIELIKNLINELKKNDDVLLSIALIDLLLNGDIVDSDKYKYAHVLNTALNSFTYFKKMAQSENAKSYVLTNDDFEILKELERILYE